MKEYWTTFYLALIVVALSCSQMPNILIDLTDIDSDDFLINATA